jgi:hypothetical protein
MRLFTQTPTQLARQHAQIFGQRVKFFRRNGGRGFAHAMSSRDDMI